MPEEAIMSETPTEFGFSYEYGIDINVGTSEIPEWQPFRFISAVAPQVSPVTQPAQTYDDNGAPNNVKTAESWTLAFTIQQHRTPVTGEYLPEVEALLALVAPDAVGRLATGNFRWYDKPAVGEANPDDAFEGNATVEMNRGETGNDGIGGWSVTLTGQGRRTQIANPLTVEGGV